MTGTGTVSVPTTQVLESGESLSFGPTGGNELNYMFQNRTGNFNELYNELQDFIAFFTRATTLGLSGASGATPATPREVMLRMQLALQSMLTSRNG
jgi:hypothetical protein